MLKTMKRLMWNKIDVNKQFNLCRPGLLIVKLYVAAQCFLQDVFNVITGFGHKVAELSKT